MFDIFFSDRSRQWPATRKKHLISQPNCQSCHSYKNLEVHHIEPYHINPNRELDPQNLITLCKTCHLVFGHLMDYKSWNTNVVKDCELYSSKIKTRPYHENFGINNNDHSFINKFISWYKKSFSGR